MTREAQYIVYPLSSVNDQKKKKQHAIQLTPSIGSTSDIPRLRNLFVKSLEFLHEMKSSGILEVDSATSRVDMKNELNATFSKGGLFYGVI